MRANLFGNPIDIKGQILGCSSCPLDRAPGVNKVKGLVRIKGRRAFLWAQSPDSRENEKRIELVGSGGKLVWDEGLGYHGLTRDIFDVQNVLRCQPLGDVEIIKGQPTKITPSDSEHTPTKEELRCCSVYNHEALELNRERAQVHVILGDIAGSQLLGKDFKKDTPVFWHEPWNAYVLLNQHPYELQKSGTKGWAFYNWRARFGAVKAILNNPGRFGYIKAQNYQMVRTEKEFDTMEAILRKESQSRCVSFDLEDDTVDGRKVILLAGFGVGHFTDPKDYSSWTGRAWSVVLEHPESGYTPEHLEYMKSRVKVLVEDKTIHKALAYGAYDNKRLKQTLGATLRGYEYDTQYGTFIRHSFLRSCGLEPLTYLFFPEFCDYKTVVEPWEKTGFAKAPLKELVLRNCGDCDVTQRLAERFAPQINPPLVKVYIHAGMQLDKMEQVGPILDMISWRKAEEVIPKMMLKLDRMLQRIAEDPNFDIDKPLKVAELIYDKLGIEPDEEYGRSTNKLALEKLLAETGNQTLDLIMKRRTVGKIKSTYLNGYFKSAEMHGGEIRTRWHLTGAATGRLRSGGEGQPGMTNLQNLHGNSLMQNLLVADLNWRKFLDWASNKSLPDSLLDQEVLLAADGSQIELRALAELSNDPILIKQFQDAALDRTNPLKDVHCQVGHMMTGWPLQRIKDDKKTRRVCKNVHFGIAFGLGENNVHPYVVGKMRAVDGPNVDLSDITPARMQKLHRQYFKVYKGVGRFIAEQRIKAEKQGFVETLFGFRREIFQDDETRNTYWGNQCVNSPVQGTAHQFMLIALALLDMKPRTYCYLQKCIAEIHDALLFRVKLRHLAEAYKQLMMLFEVDAYNYAQRQFGLKLRVPLLAEATAGMCMGSMVEYTGESLPVFLEHWKKKQAEVEATPWEDFMPAYVA